jgi:DNA sulfur modification protein DndE
MYHQINITTSKSNKEVVQKLTKKLPSGTKENVIARIALGYSLQTGKKFTSGEFNAYDSGGKEYKDHIIFDAKYRDYYIALISQYYEVHRDNTNIPKYFKLHIDHGLESMNELFENNPKYTIFDFLIDYLDKGISHLEDVEVSLDPVKNNNQKIEKSFFSSPLSINVGKGLEDSSPINLTLNDTSLYNNCHMAVAGNSGTGKTQFALELLSQINEKSNGNVNFIYLDFKGLKKDDLEYYKPFFDRSNSTFIDAPITPFPLNPLTFIDNINEKNKLMGISKFVDIISKYTPSIGKKQEQKLKDATKEAFLDKNSGEYPTIKEIYEKLLETYDGKVDTLTEVLSSLSDYEIFEPKPKQNFLNKNYYLSLSGDLPNEVRFTSTFLVINYIYNTFMNMENTPVEHGSKGIRYVLLIDEAHVIFKEKKSQDLLEKILREIRSKGVSVVLLSQGIEEFNQPSFDFSSMCEIAFLLDIKNKGNLKMINKFLGFGEKDTMKVKSSMEKIENGQAISNIKEFEKAELFILNQFRNN